jgi:outer membrane lipoprotein carrier protein
MAVVKYLFRSAIKSVRRSVSGWVLLLLWVMSFSTLVSASAAPAAASVYTDTEATEDLKRKLPIDQDAALLEARLQTLAAYSASFIQDIQGARGQLLERSSGHVSVLRPAFRWQVDDPYPQIIVADQALLKIYDPDLEQLTIRPMDEALKDTPISLLSRDAIALSGDFTITRVAEEEGEMFIVVPRSEETLYAEIRLQFSSAHLIGLGILDHLGQYTQISFTPDPDSTVIQSSDFQLEVPPGTDVIGG